MGRRKRISDRHRRALATAGAIVLSAMLAGCDLVAPDSPTNFVIATPVRAAGDGAAVIFEAPSESFTCPFLGGSVSLVAAPQAGDANGVPQVSFAYRLTEKHRNDVVMFSTSAGTLYLDGRGEYALVPHDRPIAYRPLRGMGKHGDRLAGDLGIRLTLTQIRQNHYLVRADRLQGGVLFSGVVIPLAGQVYLRDMLFSSLLTSYAGKSEHDCGNWTTATDAAAAMKRTEAQIPK